MPAASVDGASESITQPSRHTTPASRISPRSLNKLTETTDEQIYFTDKAGCHCSVALFELNN